MAIPFVIYDSTVSYNPRKEWEKFVKAMHEKAAQENSKFDQSKLMFDDHKLSFVEFMQQELNKYQATTNWNNADDPIWFPDHESLTLFLLEWS
jgi:hypothetical protein